MVDCGRFVAAMHHAIGALGVARFKPVLRPIGIAHEFIKGIDVPFVDEVARFLPTKQTKGWVTSGGAVVLSFAHQEFEEQHRLIELPTLLAVGEQHVE